MTRLGLSDSMRSTASLEDTASLPTAMQYQVPHRRHAVENVATFSRQKTKLKPTVFFNPLRVFVGSIIAVVLLSTGARVLSPSLHAWSSSSSKVEEKFEQLEKSLSLLYRDTARLKTTADKFLQQCKETHVAVSTRKEMLQNAAIRRFEGQVTMQTEEHVQVTKEVLQYYAEQKQKIQETKERLIRMNISLPVEIAMRPLHMSWQEEQKMIKDSGELLEREDTRAHGLSDAMKGLVLFAETNQLQDKNDYQRFSVESISIPTAGHLESSNQQSTVGSLAWHGSIFFYVCVVCASAVYLWNAILDTRKKELLEDKWSWSPVPKAVIRLKRLLGSLVVIEDLRTPRNEDVSHKLLEHIKPIEC
ncbi:hypothetical protein KXD40_001235 [Peronospora effusa]|nr:hypothetical protein KXD40_001235 [Peronospora effusa]